MVAEKIVQDYGAVLGSAAPTPAVLQTRVNYRTRRSASNRYWCSRFE